MLHELPRDAHSRFRHGRHPQMGRKPTILAADLEFQVFPRMCPLQMDYMGHLYQLPKILQMIEYAVMCDQTDLGLI